MHIATCVWQEKAAAMGAAAGGRAGECRVSLVALLAAAGRALNCVVSFVVFSFLDVLDMVLCLVYKVVDYAVEAEWKPCYCSAAAREDGGGGAGGAAGAKGALSFVGPRAAAGTKVVRLSSSSANKMQLEDVSDTLYVRASLLSDATRKPGPIAPALTVSPAIAELIRGKIDRAPRPPRQAPCWSDCDCKMCHSWSTGSRASHLYVHVQAPPPPPPSGAAEQEAVVFIHGFISSSVFWTETVFPAFSSAARGRYRMFAVDLLGFGRSPKPADSLYTLREHLEMIERSVLQRYRLKTFHVVAHSLGSVLALALAVKYPGAVKSLTLLAPPYFPVPAEEAGAATQYVMRRVAPRRVWPPIAFGASMACWYEHVSRTICLTICRHHRVWNRLFRIFTRNRMRTFLIEAFMCHTHNAAWHTLHNIMCLSASKMGAYLDVVAGQLSCKVALFHGRDDELLPVECTLAVGARVPRARVTVYDNKDHITIVVGQEKLFAAELEAIWRSAAQD
ncbi:probable lysophospholipase BODYGUARD 1 [Triticum dicoccoides]|uniref:probable lysophospholipase BODYGUARD 1 n=1 Tax=Triticum dicoccoides TaxID=85692 RepID=UPI000E79708C|nr:probable lysophospholipase BODYGUARD 1 [Triticum dicoccoides]